MKTPDVWEHLVTERKEVVEGFRDHSEDQAILWADKELKNYQRALLLIVEKFLGCSSPECAGSTLNRLEIDDYQFIMTVLRRAHAPRRQ